MKTFSQQMEAALQGIPPTKLPAGKTKTNPAPAVEVFPPEIAHTLHGSDHPTKHPGEGLEPRVFPCVVID